MADRFKRSELDHIVLSILDNQMNMIIELKKDDEEEVKLAQGVKDKIRQTMLHGLIEDDYSREEVNKELKRRLKEAEEALAVPRVSEPVDPLDEVLGTPTTKSMVADEISDEILTILKTNEVLAPYGLTKGDTVYVPTMHGKVLTLRIEQALSKREVYGVEIDRNGDVVSWEEVMVGTGDIYTHESGAVTAAQGRAKGLTLIEPPPTLEPVYWPEG